MNFPLPDYTNNIIQDRYFLYRVYGEAIRRDDKKVLVFGYPQIRDKFIIVLSHIELDELIQYFSFKYPSWDPYSYVLYHLEQLSKYPNDREVYEDIAIYVLSNYPMDDLPEIDRIRIEHIINTLSKEDIEIIKENNDKFNIIF